jgi:NADH:ubiquinone oxidoreductase subunit K
MVGMVQIAKQGLYPPLPNLAGAESAIALAFMVAYYPLRGSLELK